MTENRSTRSRIRRRLSVASVVVAAALPSVAVLSSARSSVALASGVLEWPVGSADGFIGGPTEIDRQIVSEATLRAALGVSPASAPLETTETEARNRSRVGLWLTTEDAGRFDAHIRALDGLSPKLEQWVRSGDIAGWYPSLSITQPEVSLLVTTDARAEGARADALFAGFSVRSQASRHEAGHLDAAFTLLTRAIHPSMDVPQMGNAELVVGLRAADLLGALRSFGFDVVDVVRTPVRDRIEVRVRADQFDAVRANEGKLREQVPAAWREIVTLVPGTKPQPRQQTTETRLTPAVVARSGKRISHAASCTSGPMTYDVWSGNYYAMTAGHCQVAGSQAGANFVGVWGTYVPNSRCDLCVWGVDAVLFQIPSGTASYQFIWQPSHNDPYLDAIIGTQVSTSGMQLVCLEGAAPSKYANIHPTINASSTCGITYGTNSYGHREAHAYGSGAICGGDSGGLIRRPTGYGGSWILGLLSSSGESESEWTDDCSQRVGDSLWPAAFYYSEWDAVQARYQSSPGVNLVPVTW